ncbi:hypothetical protein DFH06DRAFT_1340676 [Mycena polygramma]|nr:hypothetical protein DFH06DRAFT_1340676 [Mycena polygramma]
MLIHNPLTGHPGMVNGHVLATLVAAPSDERPWPFEVAYPTHNEVHTSLSTSNYGCTIEPVPRSMDIVDGVPPAPALSNVPLPLFSARLPRRVRSTPPASLPTIDSPYTTVPLSIALRQLGGQSQIRYFLTHPPNVLPNFDISGMTRIRTDVKTGHHVLWLPLLPRFDTQTGEHLILWSHPFYYSLSCLHYLRMH